MSDDLDELKERVLVLETQLQILARAVSLLANQAQGRVVSSVAMPRAVTTQTPVVEVEDVDGG